MCYTVLIVLHCNTVPLSVHICLYVLYVTLCWFIFSWCFMCYCPENGLCIFSYIAHVTCDCFYFHRQSLDSVILQERETPTAHWQRTTQKQVRYSLLIGIAESTNIVYYQTSAAKSYIQMYIRLQINQNKPWIIPTYLYVWNGAAPMC